MSGIDSHANCDGYAYQQVTCGRCGRTYQCTPWDDYYCAAEGDHCCEACLVGGRKIAVVDLDAPLSEPAFRKPAGGTA